MFGSSAQEHMIKQGFVGIIFYVVVFNFFQNAEVGSNLINVTSTRATALKEKDGHVYCQPEVLYEGRIHSDTFFLTERPRTPLCDASLSCRDREEKEGS